MLSKIKTENDKADMLIQAREKSYMYASKFPCYYIFSYLTDLFLLCTTKSIRGFFAASIEAYGPVSPAAPSASATSPTAAAAPSNTAADSTAPVSGEDGATVTAVMGE